jgi:hypothetical protein
LIPVAFTKIKTPGLSAGAMSNFSRIVFYEQRIGGIDERHRAASQRSHANLRRE